MVEYSVESDSKIIQERAKDVFPRISEGLNIKEDLPDISDIARRRTVSDISRTVVEVCDLLQLHENEIEFGMEDLPEGITAMIVHKDQEPELVSPLYDHKIVYDMGEIEKLAKSFEKRGSLLNERKRNVIRVVTAHEIYHIRQKKLFPKADEKTNDAADELLDGNFKPYLKDKGERAARLFSLFYIRERGSKTLKQDFAKLSSSLYVAAEIKAMNFYSKLDSGNKKKVNNDDRPKFR